MNRKWIVTVAREYCSGGSEAARLLARELGCPCIEKDTILQRAQAIADTMPPMPEPKKKSLFPHLHRNEAQKLVSKRLANAQSQVIHQIADEGPCVILGRAADYILENRSDVLTVFFSADYKTRIDLCCQRTGLNPADAKKLIAKKDRLRSDYYAIYTSKIWGSPSCYDMHLDLGKLSKEQAVEKIIAQLKEMDRE